MEGEIDGGIEKMRWLYTRPLLSTGWQFRRCNSVSSPPPKTFLALRSILCMLQGGENHRTETSVSKIIHTFERHKGYVEPESEECMQGSRSIHEPGTTGKEEGDLSHCHSLPTATALSQPANCGDSYRLKRSHP